MLSACETGLLRSWHRLLTESDDIMSIPKIIHYCWFGRNPKPGIAEKCIKSWRKRCPDYEIIEWNEDNFDISSAPLYVQQAYAAGKWAFVTDYVRLKVVWENGGIYLDTDVELKKKLDFLLDHKAYFGFEDQRKINTGHGFGAEKGTPILREMMEVYEQKSFLLPDGSCDSTPCPERDTQVFLRHGLRMDDSMQLLEGDILILPSIYLCPIVWLTKVRRHSVKTVSIHWFHASWHTEEEQAERAAEAKTIRRDLRKQRIDAHIEAGKGKLRKLLGDKRYHERKRIVKGKHAGDTDD